MASRLTALHRVAPGRIALEVDGRAWRTVPDEVVLRSGLSVGLELDRPLLRRLRRELRRAEALATAGRALARRDLSAAALAERLAHARVAPAAARDALSGLTAAGLVDDRRLAQRRAADLVRRGFGDTAIAWRLEQEGFDSFSAREALAAQPPEAERAARLAEAQADPGRAAAALSRRGFSPETIEEAVDFLDGEA